MFPTPINPSVGSITNPNQCPDCLPATPLSRTPPRDREARGPIRSPQRKKAPLAKKLSNKHHVHGPRKGKLPSSTSNSIDSIRRINAIYLPAPHANHSKNVRTNCSMVGSSVSITNGKRVPTMEARASTFERMLVWPVGENALVKGYLSRGDWVGGTWCVRERVRAFLFRRTVHALGRIEVRRLRQSPAQFQVVGIPSWVVLGDGQLHGAIVGVEVDTFDVQDWLARLAVYERRHVRRGEHGGDVLAGPGNRTREDKLL